MEFPSLDKGADNATLLQPREVLANTYYADAGEDLFEPLSTVTLGALGDSYYEYMLKQ